MEKKTAVSPTVRGEAVVVILFAIAFIFAIIRLLRMDMNIDSTFVIPVLFALTASILQFRIFVIGERRAHATEAPAEHEHLAEVIRIYG